MGEVLAHQLWAVTLLTVGVCIFIYLIHVLMYTGCRGVRITALLLGIALLRLGVRNVQSSDMDGLTVLSLMLYMGWVGGVSIQPWLSSLVARATANKHASIAPI